MQPRTARRTILIDLLFNASLGLAFASCARDRTRADGVFAAPAFPLVLVFVGVVLMPVLLYFQLAHPAWSWMYAVNPDEVPGLAIVPILAAHGGVVIVGWYVGGRLVRSGRDRIVLYAAGGGAALMLLSLILFWSRIGAYAHGYGDFHKGYALDLFDVKLGYVLVGVVIGTAAAATYVAFELARDSRRVRTR